MELMKADIEFVVGEKIYKFKVIHNLPEIFGLSIEDALNSWLARTSKYQCGLFCKYVMSKDESVVCMSERTFKRLSH